MVAGVSSAPEYPELQPRPRPERKEQTGNKLPNVRRDAKVCVESHDDTEVYKIVQPHKENKTNNLICCLAFASFITKDPVAVDDKEEDVREDAWHGERQP